MENNMKKKSKAQFLANPMLKDEMKKQIQSKKE